MRKICVVTSNRAEYGIMSSLIKKIEDDDDLELQLVVTGSHLSKKFGYTLNEISSTITEKIDIEIEEEPSHSTALAIEKFSDVFSRLNPDILMLLGDRYEIMAVAIAAMLNNLPIAHLCGGDTTAGAIDEAIRHSITKMSHIHFPSCEESRARIIQLGESPNNIFSFGDLSIENIETLNLLSKQELQNNLGFKFGEKNLLVTFHPVTLENSTSYEQFNELLSALDKLKDTKIIFTKPNSDHGSQKIINLIDEYTKKNPNTIAFQSLGFLRYFSCLQFVDGVVGNSSSGIVEAPSFKIGTINIGDRQKGRTQASSVINCKPSKEEILAAINKLYSKEFQNNLKNVKNVYGQENTSSKIIEVLKSFDLENITKKVFFNL